MQGMHMEAGGRDLEGHLSILTATGYKPKEKEKLFGKFRIGITSTI